MNDQNPKSAQQEVIPPGSADADLGSEQEYAFTYEGFQSPLLPPAILKQYGEVVPNLDKKLVQWSEEETKHRRSLERDAFDEVRTLRSRASLVGPSVAICGIMVSGAVAILNPSWAGSAAAFVIATVAVGGPFAARILATRFNHHDGGEE